MDSGTRKGSGLDTTSFSHSLVPLFMYSNSIFYLYPFYLRNEEWHSGVRLNARWKKKAKTIRKESKEWGMGTLMIYTFSLLITCKVTYTCLYHFVLLKGSLNVNQWILQFCSLSELLYLFCEHRSKKYKGIKSFELDNRKIQR